MRICVRVGNQNDRDAFADIFRRVGLELLRPETVHPTGAPSHSNLEAETATPERTLDDVPRRLKFERAGTSHRRCTSKATAAVCRYHETAILPRARHQPAAAELPRPCGRPRQASGAVSVPAATAIARSASSSPAPSYR